MPDAASPEERLCEAVGKELDANSGLPEHATILYRRPRIVLPEDGNVLVVWIDSEGANQFETGRMNYAVNLGISWHQPSVESVTELLDDPELEKDLLRNMRKIKDRIHFLAYRGDLGIEQVWQLTPSGWQYFSSEFDDGVTEGYAGSLVAQMTEIPPES